MPRLPPRPCGAPRCGKMATRRGRCDEHQPKHNWKHDKSASERGYDKKWAKRRKRILIRDNYLCQEHKRNGMLIAADQVDHRVPKSQGGTDDDSNLEAICNDCHKRKTAREAIDGRNKRRGENTSKLDSGN